MSKLTNKNRHKTHHRKNKTRKNDVSKRDINENDNFYYFVNKSWFNKNFIAKDSSIKNEFSILQQKVNKQLQTVITKHIFKEHSPDAKRCKNLYYSMYHFNDELVEQHIYTYIEQINNFRRSASDHEFYKFLAWLKLNGISSPITLNMVNNEKYHDRYILAIGEGSCLSFSIKEIYLNPKSELIKQYTEFIRVIFALIFGPENPYCAEDVVSIETELASKIYTPEDNNNILKNIIKYTPDQIKSKCHFDFSKFIKDVGFKNINKSSYKVNVINAEYIKHVTNLMSKEWTTNKWNSFWVFRLLVFVSSFHSQLYKHFFAFFLLKLNGILQMKPRCMFATSFVSNIMNSTVSRKYIEYYKNEQQKVFVTDLTNKIKTVFKERVTRNKWLTSNTKELALKKLDAMSYAIGYRHKYLEDPDCNFLDNDAISNLMMVLQWENKYVIRVIHKKIPNKSYWLKNEEQNVFDVNAHYNGSENELIIPNAILQSPYVKLDKDISYNLANIGFIIAHEMIHGFDKLGCQFDENGDMNNWWTKEDATNYKKLQAEIIEQYETMAKRDGIKLNGELTISENIADSSALQFVEDVLEDYLIERDIFGKNQEKYFKDLYYNYAKQWRTLLNIKQLKNITLLDTHSLTNYRVNCVLVRSERFRQIFDIKPGDGMYYGKEMNQIW
jgi:predicted metalloendopeptidase